METAEMLGGTTPEIVVLAIISCFTLRINTIHLRYQQEMYLDFIGKDDASMVNLMTSIFLF